MYTVIVADDEEEIRRSLVKKVNWTEIGFQVVGEAENGIEALELVEKLQPDLLLTDIRMPFISGIELARQVREIRPTMQIAFLSGFDDFSYAQQAIQYNIISYLLKPISSKELTRELTLIKEKIDQKFLEFSSKSSMQEKMEKSEFLMPLMLDNFQGRLSESEHRQLMKNAVSCGILKGEDTGNIKFAVMITTIIDENGKNCTTKASARAIDTILKKYVRYSSIYVKGRAISLLMATSMGFDKYLHILVEDIVQSMQRILHLNACIGISRIADDLAGCHECYLEAMNALSYSGNTGRNVHFIDDEERTEEFDQEAIQKTIGDIETLLRGGTIEELTVYLEEFFGNIEKGKISHTAANYILLQIIAAIYQVLNAVAGNEAVQKLQQKFPLNGAVLVANSRETLQFYMDLCISARELISEQRQKSSMLMCDRAIRIVYENYMDPDLSLVSVSSEIAVSPNYLSALIKKDTGYTFKDLLTKKRIETAKELLLNTPMKVREISERCGYNDQHYFSYCFKKYVGTSPNNCRRDYEEAKKE